MEDTAAARVLITGSVILLTVYFVLLARKKRRYPPGPKGWPVVGNVFSITALPHRYFAKLVDKYGPLIFMHFGQRPVLVVSNADMAREVLQTHDSSLASRPPLAIGGYLTYHRQDIVFAPLGSHWNYMRKICTTELFTLTRVNRFQEMRELEVQRSMQDVLETWKQGTEVEMHTIYLHMLTNFMTQMMWNKSHFGDLTSDDFAGFKEYIPDLLDLGSIFNIGDFIPALSPVSMKVLGYDRKMKDLMERSEIYLGKILEDNHKNAGKNKNEGFLDVLLSTPKEGVTPDSKEKISPEIVKAVLNNLLIGGTDTPAIALEWALTETIRHPSIMQKAQDELDSVVGRDRLVSESDIPNLPYMQAVVKEVMRLHPPLPLALPHHSVKACEIRGYHVPANTQIFINLFAIHTDPALWDRPLEFDPSRFLGSNVDLKGRDFELLPFGSGRRICPARSLGLLMVQFALAQSLHAFKWTLPDGCTEAHIMEERFALNCSKVNALKAYATPRLPVHVISPTS